MIIPSSGFEISIILQLIDFYRFEEVFKLGTSLQADDRDGTPKTMRKMSKRPETISLLEANRLRNVGQYRLNI